MAKGRQQEFIYDFKTGRMMSPTQNWETSLHKQYGGQSAAPSNWDIAPVSGPKNKPSWLDLANPSDIRYPSHDVTDVPNVGRGWKKTIQSEMMRDEFIQTRKTLAEKGQLPSTQYNPPTVNLELDKKWQSMFPMGKQVEDTQKHPIVTVADIEATSTDPKQARIVAVAATRWQLQDHGWTRIDPGYQRYYYDPYPNSRESIAARINAHGLTNADIARARQQQKAKYDASYTRQEAKAFADYIDDTTLVTFNGREFDVPALNRHGTLKNVQKHLDLLFVAQRAGVSGWAGSNKKDDIYAALSGEKAPDIHNPLVDTLLEGYIMQNFYSASDTGPEVRAIIHGEGWAENLESNYTPEVIVNQYGKTMTPAAFATGKVDRWYEDDSGNWVSEWNVNGTQNSKWSLDGWRKAVNTRGRTHWSPENEDDKYLATVDSPVVSPPKRKKRKGKHRLKFKEFLEKLEVKERVKQFKERRKGNMSVIQQDDMEKTYDDNGNSVLSSDMHEEGEQISTIDSLSKKYIKENTPSGNIPSEILQGLSTNIRDMSKALELSTRVTAISKVTQLAKTEEARFMNRAQFDTFASQLVQGSDKHTLNELYKHWLDTKEAHAEVNYEKDIARTRDRNRSLLDRQLKYIDWNEYLSEPSQYIDEMTSKPLSMDTADFASQLEDIRHRADVEGHRNKLVDSWSAKIRNNEWLTDRQKDRLNFELQNSAAGTSSPRDFDNYLRDFSKKLKDAAQQTERFTGAVSGTLQAFNSLNKGIYDPSRIVSAFDAGFGDTVRGAGGFTPSFMKRSVGYGTNAVSQGLQEFVSSRRVMFNRVQEGFQVGNSIAGVVGSGIGFSLGGPAGAMLGGAIAQVPGTLLSMGTRMYGESQEYALSTSLAGLSKKFNMISALVSLFVDSLKFAVNGIKKLFFGGAAMLAGVMAPLVRAWKNMIGMGNPVTLLSGMHYQSFQGSQITDRLAGLSAGTQSNAAENFGSQSSLLYSMGSFNLERIKASAIAGVFQHVYNPEGTAEDNMTATLNSLHKQMQGKSPEEKRRLTALAGQIDSSYPRLLQLMDDFGINDYADVLSGKMVKMGTYSPGDAEARRRRMVGAEYNAALTGRGNIWQGIAANAWNYFGSTWYGGTNRAFNKMANNDFSGAVDEFKKTVAATFEGIKKWLKDMGVKDWWDELHIGDKISNMLADGFSVTLGKFAAKAKEWLEGGGVDVDGIVGTIKQIGVVIIDTFKHIFENLLYWAGSINIDWKEVLKGIITGNTGRIVDAVHIAEVEALSGENKNRFVPMMEARALMSADWGSPEANRDKQVLQQRLLSGKMTNAEYMSALTDMANKYPELYNNEDWKKAIIMEAAQIGPAEYATMSDVEKSQTLYNYGVYNKELSSQAWEGGYTKVFDTVGSIGKELGSSVQNLGRILAPIAKDGLGKLGVVITVDQKGTVTNVETEAENSLLVEIQKKIQAATGGKRAIDFKKAFTHGTKGAMAK